MGRLLFYHRWRVMSRPKVYNDGTGDGLREFSRRDGLAVRAMGWRIDVQRGFDWVPMSIRIDGVPMLFGARKQAQAYWYDTAPGRNDRARFVRAG
jgi:hypothetical protein